MTAPIPLPDATAATLDPEVALPPAQRQALREAVATFREQPVTPERSVCFEQTVAAIYREAGRVLVEREYNRIEPAHRADCPVRLRFAGEEYKRRPKSRKRIGTLFGEIELWRYLYEPIEPGERCLFPLEVQLGIEAGLASPALAERVGFWATEHEQEQVLELLREHGVSWSVASLRKVTTALRDGLASFREEAQIAKLLEALTKAEKSKGRHRPVLVAGRDGIHVPIRGARYQEGATATVAVLNRRGQRLTTVYLGQMPESGQGTLSAQLTALLTEVLRRWHARGGKPPRLEYVTDGGNHPRDYYQKVLRHLPDPWHPGRTLSWQWVLDFWHACGYVQQLVTALFGEGERAEAWYRKWRRWLRDRRRGVSEVLRSASWHYNHRQLSKAKEELFWKGYRYLRKHAVWMQYADYRRQGLQIGSGVTEAACKTVFAERLKRSGMTWNGAGGQVIVDLRVLVLSDVWPQTHQAYLRARPQPTVEKAASYHASPGQFLENAS